MQCPKCAYEPTMSEQQPSPGDCVRCNINYEGYARSQAEARSEFGGRQSGHVARLVADHRGAAPVVVVDVHMGFSSMVWFMVKWAIASIPALIILVALGIAVFALVAGGISGLRLAAISAEPPKVMSAGGESIEVPNPAGMGEFWLLSESESRGYVVGSVRFISPGESQMFSEFTVDCANAIGALTKLGPSIQAMQPTGEGFAAIEPGSRRHYVALRLCRDRPERHQNYQ